jgi:outer membrane immunogenic protein
MRRFGLPALVAAAAAVAAPAFAADIAVPPAAAPAPAYRPALYNWTGFYLGGHIGGGLLEDTFTDTTTVTETSGTATTVNPFGLIGGLQGGFNYEFTPWVIGVEGTWTPSYISGTATTTATALTPTLGTGIDVGSTSAPRWYATLAARFGYADDDVLFYGKAGAAVMRVDYTQEIINNGISNSTETLGEHRVGFVIGAGIEYGITENLSAKVEYDFLDFGTQSYSFGNLSKPDGTALGAVPVSIESTTHMFTAGLNYRFNWDGGGLRGPTY